MRKVKTTPQRSELMRRVRQRGTEPELIAQQLLREMGYSFRTTGIHLPGSPDLYENRTRRAVFVHGCFWHRHSRCKAATIPRSNARFWKEKFEANIARDRLKHSQLKRLGYRVLTIWSCQLKNPAKLKRLKGRIERFLNP